LPRKLSAWVTVALSGNEHTVGSAVVGLAILAPAALMTASILSRRPARAAASLRNDRVA
jgi:hypothetical protein